MENTINKKVNKGYKIIDFMKWKNIIITIASIYIFFTLIIISMRGFNWGIDFSGGAIIEISFDQPIEIENIRNLLKTSNLKNPLLQTFGNSYNIIIRIPTLNSLNISHVQEIGNQIIEKFRTEISQKAKVKKTEFIGPNVGIDLAQTSIVAFLIAILSILVYVGFRFEWRIAFSVIIALLHDVIVTTGILSMFNIEIDLNIIAALLSIIGYSLNDSIVIFDRIRENFRKMQYSTVDEIFNLSLTQTLSRTFITSGTTLTVILILYFFGGPILSGFSFTMLIGIIIGTLSSIYVASTLARKLGVQPTSVLSKKKVL